MRYFFGLLLNSNFQQSVSSGGAFYFKRERNTSCWNLIWYTIERFLSGFLAASWYLVVQIWKSDWPNIYGDYLTAKPLAKQLPSKSSSSADSTKLHHKTASSSTSSVGGSSLGLPPPKKKSQPVKISLPSIPDVSVHLSVILCHWAIKFLMYLLYFISFIHKMFWSLMMSIGSCILIITHMTSNESK